MYSSTTMDRMSISLSKPQRAYLRAEAERLGISIGDLIRRIIDQHRFVANGRTCPAELEDMSTDDLRVLFAQVLMQRSGS